MSHSEALKFGITQEPDIVHGTDRAGRAFVVIGSHDHGMKIPQASVPKLVIALNGVEALKMEGEGTEEASKRYHPRSTEVLVKACVDQSHFSWISESDGEDLGQKLSKHGVSEGIMEVYVPSLSMRWHGGTPDGFFQNLPRTFDYYKSRFGFLNVQHGVETFLEVANFWMRHRLNPKDLMDFSYDFEMFMGSVREYDYWRSDLRRFREDYSGRIAVCCGAYHIPFVQSVLEGQEIEKPDWPNHIDKNNDPFVVERRDSLKGIYQNIESALSGSI